MTKSHQQQRVHDITRDRSVHVQNNTWYRLSSTSS